MDDEYPIEGEQEWPYLVREVPDKPKVPDNLQREVKKTQSSGPELTFDERIEAIINGIQISDGFRSILKAKVNSFLNSPGCTRLEIDGFLDYYTFVFVRQNRYIATVDKFELLTGLENEHRVFHDCYTTHVYNDLIASPEFQSMISKTGMEFIECLGGFVTDYSMADDEFTFSDELDIRVILKKGSSRRVYHLDLEKMELSKDYMEL